MRGPWWKRRDRARHVSLILAIEALIGEIREVHDAFVHEECAATVFVDAGADIEGVAIVRRHGLDVVAPSRTVYKVASLFLRLGLAPVDCAAIEGDLIEPDSVLHDEVGRDWGHPETIGAGNHRFHRLLLPVRYERWECQPCTKQQKKVSPLHLVILTSMEADV